MSIPTPGAIMYPAQNIHAKRRLIGWVFEESASYILDLRMCTRCFAVYKKQIFLRWVTEFNLIDSDFDL